LGRLADEDALAAVALAHGPLRGDDAAGRPRHGPVPEKGGARRHLRPQDVVGIEEADLDLDDPLGAGGRRDDLAPLALVLPLGAGFGRDLGLLADLDLPDVRLVDVGDHLERAAVDQRAERAADVDPARGPDVLARLGRALDDDAVEGRTDQGVLEGRLRLLDSGAGDLPLRLRLVEQLLPLDPGLDDLLQTLVLPLGV